MTDELKPCPFCGKEPYSEFYAEALNVKFFVQCVNPNCGVEPCTDDFDTEEAAIAAWNRRGEVVKSELKPCPFCGKEAHMLQNGDTYQVRCDNYYCDVCPVTDLFDTEAAAIAAWNRRAGDGIDNR